VGEPTLDEDEQRDPGTMAAPANMIVICSDQHERAAVGSCHVIAHAPLSTVEID
jgi:hypothetical protein